MSSAVKYAALAMIAALFAGCTAQTDTDFVLLDLGDVDDYQDFLEERGDIKDPEPFEPEPLFVSAIGKVQAKPDIAVITATISAEDKNESRAVNEMGQIINAVQNALKGRNVETGFTAINSSRKFNPLCKYENNFAQQRHSEIRNDYFFNKRLDDKGDTKTKRRDPKPRVAQQVCLAQSLKVSTNMVVRIEPADGAGDVLRALSNAGAKNSRLYGYDFTDYDALYQEAAQKAVKLARVKANVVARLSGATLGELQSFSISTPERTGRFGPQPNVIRPANRYRGPDGSVIDRHVDDNKNYEPERQRRRRLESIYGGSDDEIIVTATRINSKTIANSPTPVTVFDIASEQLQTNGLTDVANALVNIPRTTTSTSQSPVSSGNTNALSISLLSGLQTISVAAQLGYTYDTPLNGKIIVEPQADN